MKKLKMDFDEFCSICREFDENNLVAHKSKYSQQISYTYRKHLIYDTPKVKSFMLSIGMNEELAKKVFTSNITIAETSDLLGIEFTNIIAEKTQDSDIQNLIRAILKQARKDLVGQSGSTAEDRLTSIMFYSSQWFTELTGYGGNEILEMLYDKHYITLEELRWAKKWREKEQAELKESYSKQKTK